MTPVPGRRVQQERSDCVMHAATVDGEPGVVLTSGGAVVQVAPPGIAGEVRSVSITNNPDKLSRWSVARVE